MDIVEIRQPFKHSDRDLAHDLNVNRAMLLVDPVQRALVHVLHANVNVGVGNKRAVKGDDVFGMAVVHDLQLAENLFANGWLRINKDHLEVRKPMFQD